MVFPSRWSARRCQRTAVVRTSPRAGHDRVTHALRVVPGAERGADAVVVAQAHRLHGVVQAGLWAGERPRADRVVAGPSSTRARVDVQGVVGGLVAEPAA